MRIIYFISKTTLEMKIKCSLYYVFHIFKLSIKTNGNTIPTSQVLYLKYHEQDIHPVGL